MTTATVNAREYEWGRLVEHTRAVRSELESLTEMPLALWLARYAELKVEIAITAHSLSADRPFRTRSFNVIACILRLTRNHLINIATY
jgi:hypothetical protein